MKEIFTRIKKLESATIGASALNDLRKAFTQLNSGQEITGDNKAAKIIRKKFID